VPPSIALVNDERLRDDRGAGALEGEHMLARIDHHGGAVDVIADEPSVHRNPHIGEIGTGGILRFEDERRQRALKRVESLETVASDRTRTRFHTARLEGFARRSPLAALLEPLRIGIRLHANALGRRRSSRGGDGERNEEHAQSQRHCSLKCFTPLSK
jgi:hypothetical protein